VAFFFFSLSLIIFAIASVPPRNVALGSAQIPSSSIRSATGVCSDSAVNAPSLNFNLGGVNVSLGGPAGTGVYRTSEGVGVQADGIRDGVMKLIGIVRRGVDRIAIP